jgi:hypothetical protein
MRLHVILQVVLEAGLKGWAERAQFAFVEAVDDAVPATKESIRSWQMSLSHWNAIDAAESTLIAIGPSVSDRLTAAPHKKHNNYNASKWGRAALDYSPAGRGVNCLLMPHWLCSSRHFWMHTDWRINHQPRAIAAIVKHFLIGLKKHYFFMHTYNWLLISLINDKL